MVLIDALQAWYTAVINTSRLFFPWILTNITPATKSMWVHAFCCSILPDHMPAVTHVVQVPPNCSVKESHGTLLIKVMSLVCCQKLSNICHHLLSLGSCCCQWTPLSESPKMSTLLENSTWHIYQKSTKSSCGLIQLWILQVASQMFFVHWSKEVSPVFAR